MKTKITALLLGSMLVVFAGWASAQDSDTNAKSKSATRTITGCLSKGDNSATSNEFLLTGSDGSTWEVRSDAFSLAEHVGQTVSATGVVKHATAHNLKEDAKDAVADAHMKKDTGEHGPHDDHRRKDRQPVVPEIAHVA